MPRVRALITGGAGFVGRAIADALLARGDEVVILDSIDARVHGSQPPIRPGVRLVRGDVRVDRAVTEAIGEGVDVVFHEAAMVGLGRGAVDAEGFMDTNVVGTIRLLHALKRASAPPGRVILASTMALYGEGAYWCSACDVSRSGVRRADDLAAQRWDARCPSCSSTLEPRAVSEERATSPATAYAISKHAQEAIAFSLGRDSGLPVVALRYHNVYGAHMPRDTPYAGVASFFKSRILAGRPALVHEDGGQLRDFVRVEDVARANVLAATAPVADVAFEAFNIGTGEPRPILDLALELGSAMGSDLKPEVTGRFRMGDARHVFASITKAQRVLGYAPRIGFEEGVRLFAQEPARPPPGGA